MKTRIFKKSLKIPKRSLEVVNLRRDNTIVKEKEQKDKPRSTNITHYHYGEILEHYWETLKQIWLKIFCYQKQYTNSLRTVGDSLKEHNSHTPFYLTVIIFFIYHKCLNILIIRHALCQTYVCMVLERTSYISDNKICLN